MPKRLIYSDRSMLVNRILSNLSLLAQGKIKLQEIPPKIVNLIFNYNRSARRAKRSRFAINEEVVFRPLVLSDRPDYLEFVSIYLKKDRAQLEKEIPVPKCDGETLCYVALYRNRIAGKVDLIKKASNGVDVWQIGGLSVLPGLRGFGIGERLMRAGMSEIDKGGVIMSLSVNKDNLRAIRLYKKLGFKVAGAKERLRVGDIRNPPHQIIMILEKAAAK